MGNPAFMMNSNVKQLHEEVIFLNLKNKLTKVLTCIISSDILNKLSQESYKTT